MRRLERAALALAGLLLCWCAVLGSKIVAEGAQRSTAKADAAIILGAAIDGGGPSPVFEMRIQHGIHLYKSGRVKKLLFTGGHGEGARLAESVVAGRYAVRAGVPAAAILIETFSRTTQQNLFHAKRVMQAEGLDEALIVSDPLHMKRAMKMCEGLGIKAVPSPTPTSRYRTWRSKTGFLLREIYFYNVYLLTGQ